ncbi:MAG: ABC transporter ATP-binding protein [Planctomycetota bacterium]
MIRARNLQVRFGDKIAVGGLDVQLQPRTITSLVGPSGCGKTTLLRTFAGLQQPTAGSMDVDARDPGDASFVFQKASLLPWLRAIDNVRVPLDLIGRGTVKQRRRLAAEMLERVDLAGSERLFPHELSGGMQMRVSIARALVTRPKVLFLDEPFAALDEILRVQMGQLLHQVWRDDGFTAVMVTHHIAESIAVSHRILVMHAGRLAGDLDNPLEWPRMRDVQTDSRFGELYEQIAKSMRGNHSGANSGDDSSADVPEPTF